MAVRSYGVRRDITSVRSTLMRPARASTSTILVAMLISRGGLRLTCRVEQPGEGTVEANPDLHVIVLAFRLDVCNRSTEGCFYVDHQ